MRTFPQANVPPDVAGEWERVGPIYRLAAAAGTITFSGLTGDAVGGYKLFGRGGVTTISALNLNINGANTNMVPCCAYFNNSGIAATSSISYNFAVAGRYQFELEFRDTKSGVNRGAMCKSWYYDTAGNITHGMFGAVGWEDTASVVTALSMVHSGGLFASGFEYELWKRPKDV